MTIVRTEIGILAWGIVNNILDIDYTEDGLYKNKIYPLEVFKDFVNQNHFLYKDGSYDFDEWCESFLSFARIKLFLEYMMKYDLLKEENLF